MNRDTVPTHIRRAFGTVFTAEERADGSLPTLKGHAAVFNKLSEDLGGWKERIWPGSFDGLLNDPGCYELWNHNPDFIIAAVADGTLRLSVDAIGLFSEADPMDTQTVRDLVVTPIRQGKIRKMSFAFDVGTAEWSVEDGLDIREIRQFSRLYDTSPVTYPAYPDTDISARTLEVLVQSLSPLQRDQLSALVAPAARVQADAAAGRPPSAAGVELEQWRRRVALYERIAATETMKEGTYV